MTAPKAEGKRLRLIRSLLVSCNLYTAALSEPARAVRDDLRPTVTALLRVIALCYKGDAKVDTAVDWVKKANALAPAAFAALFGGDPNSASQRACRDLKLMDAVFGMGYAAYARCYPADPWAVGGSALNGPRAVQKMVHVALQAMCAGNQASQDYFGRRSSFVLARPSADERRALAAADALAAAATPAAAQGSRRRASAAAAAAGGLSAAATGAADAAAEAARLAVQGAARVSQLWMDTVLEQLEAPLGSAVTLSKLLSANEALLHKYATPKLVLRFSEMVQLLGPQRRLVDFFAAICIVQGRAVKINQEMVLRLTWMKPEVRKATYLQLRPLVQAPAVAAAAANGGGAPPSSADKAITAARGTKYGPVALPSGAFTDGTIDPASPRPADFLGKEVYNRSGGFSPVGVTWAGAAAWGRGQPEALFWDLEGLGLKATALEVDGSMGDDGEEVRVRG
jgi:hypothetical protein